MKSRQYIWLAIVALLVVLSWVRFQGQRGNPAVPPKTAGTGPSTARKPLLALGHAKKRTVTPVSVPDAQFPWRLRNTARSVDDLAHDKRAILLRNALIDTAVPGGVRVPDSLRSQGDPGSYLIQARGRVDASFKTMIEGAGGKVISYIPNDTYLVQIDANALSHIENNPKVQTILPYEPYYKLDTKLLAMAINNQPVPYGQPWALTVFPGNEDQVAQYIQQLGGQVLKQESTPFGPELITRISPDKLTLIAQNTGVQAVALQGKVVALNDITRPRIGVAANSVAANYGGLTGANVLVNVNDTGIDTNHPDLATRVFPGSINWTNDTVGHGTHVAGIIAGDGSQSSSVTATQPGSLPGADFRGMAPAASLLSLPLGANSLSNAAYQNLNVYNHTNALISNNSWGTEGENDYSALSATIDAAVRDAVSIIPGEQPMILVFAAGNDGNADTAGHNGSDNTIVSPGNAKNVITVGALENYRNITNTFLNSNGVQQAFFLPITDSSNQVASFSSRGNVSPGTEGTVGRFKPDLVAPGTMIISTRSGQWDTNSYYNITNHDPVSITNIALAPNEVFSDVIPIPANTVYYNLIVAGISPTPFPGVPVYTNIDFNPSTNSAFFAGSNGFGATNTDPFFVSNAFLFYDITNTTGSNIQFSVFWDVVTTNQNGFYYNALINLNNGLAPYYRYESGTSMSAPAVSGMLALMQEFFEGNGYTNSPALMKALLINGAIPLSPLYDRDFTKTFNDDGWGLASLTNSLPLQMVTSPGSEDTWPTRFLDQYTNRVLATGDRHTYSLSVPSAVTEVSSPTVIDPTQYPIKITLVWTDPPGNPVAGIKLVNDLDLIVTNTDNGKVYYGNGFIGGSDYSVDTTLTTNVNGDVVNNVENVYLPPGAGTNFTITVFGKRVNVNAVTANTNAIVQDYALVISSGPANAQNTLSGLVTNPVVTASPYPGVTYLTADNTGSPVLNQRVGANPSTLTNTQGTNTQWVFYAVTNNTGNTNVAFITFLTPNLASPTRNDSADIDLYVSLDPNLTNLVPAVVASAVQSTNRGGTESVIFNNSTAGTVYYVGVKSEDQEAADFGFFAIATDDQFSQQNPDGSVDVFGLGLPAAIPDGDNEKPGTLRVFGICQQTIPIRRVVITNSVTHQRFSDLEIGIEHGTVSTPLKLHDSSLVPDTNGTYVMIFDDSQQNDVTGAVAPDYPGTLSGFIGKDGTGVWTLDVGDYAPDFTGTVDKLIIHLDKQEANTNTTSTVTVKAQSWFYDFIDVPVGASQLTVNVFSMNYPNTELDVYIKRGQPPTTTDFDKRVAITDQGSLTLSTLDSPPLQPGRYYVGFYNPNPAPTDLSFKVNYTITYDLSATTNLFLTFTNGSPGPTTYPVNILDDATTFVSTTVSSSNNIVAGVEVGVRIQHPRASDLVLRLISPSGTAVVLAENRGGLSTNGYGTNNASGGYIFTTFTEDTNLASIPIKFDAPPFLGNVVTTTTTNYGRPLLVSTNFYNGGGAAWGYGVSLSGGSVFVAGRYSNDVSGAETALVMSYPYPVTNSSSLNWLTNQPGTVSAGDTNNFFSVSSDAGNVYAAGISLSLTTDPSVPTLPKGFTTQFSLAGPTGGSTSGANWLTQTPSVDAFGSDDEETVEGSTLTVESGTTYLYVTGNTQTNESGTPTARATLVKLDSGGNIIWQTNDTFNDTISTDLTLTSYGHAVVAYNGNLFVAGSHQLATAGGNVQFPYVCKFASDGTQIFGTNGFVGGQYYGITTLGTNIYAVGGDTNGNALVAKYDENLNLVWNRSFAYNNQTNVFYGITGASNHLYAVGSTAANPGTDDDVYIVELLADTGIGQSQTFYGGTGSDIARGVTTDGTDIYVVGESSSYGGGFDHSLMLLRYSIATNNSYTAGYDLPEEPLSAFNGEPVGGVWTLEIVDNRVGPYPASPAPLLLGWTLKIDLANTNSLAIPLVHATPYTGTTVLNSGWTYFSVNTPYSASWATNILTSLSGNGLDWCFNQFQLPTGTGVGDFMLGANVTSVSTTNLNTTNSSPTFLPGQRYYLGVRSSNPAQTVPFTIEVDFDNTTVYLMSIKPLAVATPLSGTSSTPASNGSLTNLYEFDIPTNTASAMFEVYDTTGSTVMLLRKGSAPSQVTYDYTSSSAGGGVQRIVLRNNGGGLDLSGHWFLAVLGGGDSPVQFSLSASLSQNGLLVSALPLEINQTPTVLPNGQAQIAFNAIPGELYQVQYSTDLMNWNLLTYVQTSSGQITYTDPNANQELRFYRVVQVPQ